MKTIFKPTQSGRAAHQLAKKLRKQGFTVYLILDVCKYGPPDFGVGYYA